MCVCVYVFINIYDAYIHTFINDIYIYIYIVIHRQVLLYHNSSVLLHTQDSQNWD